MPGAVGRISVSVKMKMQSPGTQPESANIKKYGQYVKSLLP